MSLVFGKEPVLLSETNIYGDRPHIVNDGFFFYHIDTSYKGRPLLGPLLVYRL